MFRQGKNLPAQRLVHPLQVDDDRITDTLSQIRNPWHAAQLRYLADGRLFQVDPEIGHSALGIIGVAGDLKVFGGA